MYIFICIPLIILKCIYLKPNKYFGTYFMSFWNLFLRLYHKLEFAYRDIRASIHRPSPDGWFYKTTDKADFGPELKKLQNDDQPNEVVDTDISTKWSKVVIINGVAFVNAVKIQKFQTKNCSDFTQYFLKQEDTMKQE